MKIKEKKEKLVVTLILLCSFLSISTYAQKALLSRAVKDTVTSHNEPQITEQNLRYSKTILTKDFDFKLTPVSEGKFMINFPHDVKEVVSIKVYDIIGNVLYEEKVRIRGNHPKQIDLSEKKTTFFIIEIRNQEINRTKRIVAG